MHAHELERDLLRRQAVHLAHLLRGHALQSIRTKAPKIDGMDVATFAQNVDAYIRDHPAHPADHLDLCKGIWRSATALATARTCSTWAQIRRQAIKQAEKHPHEADAQLKAFKAEEAKRQAKAWKDWCRRASANGGR